MKNLPLLHCQVHHFCNGADKVWGKCMSVSLCLKQQCSQASQIQLFVKQHLVLLPNIGITIKGSAFSVFKTAHRKYLSLKALRCLSLSAKAQHGNFVIYFFTSFISYLLFLNPLSLSLKNTIFFFFFLWSTCREWEIFCTLVFSDPTIASFQRQVLLTENT